MSSVTHEIPMDEWMPYFTDLSKQYEGWATTIELLQRKLGDQTVVNGSPLQGISFETKGSATGDILVETGDLNIPYETHRIELPRVLRVSDTVPGGEIDLELESRDGITTIIRLRRRAELPPAEGG